MRWALRLLSTGALNDSSDGSTVRSLLELYNTLPPEMQENINKYVFPVRLAKTAADEEIPALFAEFFPNMPQPTDIGECREKFIIAAELAEKLDER